MSDIEKEEGEVNLTPVWGRHGRADSLKKTLIAEKEGF